MSLTKVSYSMINGACANVLDYGVKGDGSTDDTAAIQAVIDDIGSSTTIYFPAGTYLISDTLDVNIAGITIVGDGSGFNYGPNARSTVLKFSNTGVAINTYENSGDTRNVAYVTISNLTIDGDNKATIGFDGGFVSTLENVSVINCTTAGVRLGEESMASRFVNCGFNGNQDGVLSLGSGVETTITFINCAIRQNTRYGLNGGFNRSSLYSCIIESNGDSGISLTGDCSQLAFENCYFEQNDFAAGSSGYQVVANTSLSNVGPVLFNNCVFGSTGTTKVANITQGNYIFTNCTQVGDANNAQSIAQVAGNVTCINSFGSYVLPSNIKVVPDISIDPNTGLLFVSSSDAITITTPAVTFGTSDFSFSATFAVDESANNARYLVSGASSAFQIALTGSTEGINQVSIGRAGSAATLTTACPCRPNVPVQITYVRTGTTGQLFINGDFVTSVADSNNYSSAVTKIGTDSAGTGALYATLYGFSCVAAALSDSQVQKLAKTAGNVTAARITPSMNFSFQYRKSLQFHELVSSTTYAIAAGRWCSVNNV